MNSIPIPSIDERKSHLVPWRPWPFRERPWRQAIRQSQLSSEVQALLFDVVGGTGLLSDEKLEVAEELIAHFEDGLQRGRSTAALIEDFGDPQVATQLIRNGKQRTRKMKNRFVQGSLWLGALSAGGFLTLVVIFYMGKPQPRVDYLAQINKPALEAADHDKGWTIYRDLWTKHGFSEGGGFRSPEMYLRDEDGNYGRMVRPSDGPKWQAAIEGMAKIEDLLEGFRVGGVRPSFGVPLQMDLTRYSEADFKALFPTRDYAKTLEEHANGTNANNSSMMTLISTLIPHVQVMREAARLLTFDTRWALEQGDVERATRNIEAMLGISSQVTEDKFLISTLVGYAIHAITLNVIDECLHAGVRFDDGQLERIQNAVANARIEKMIDLASEKAMFMDIIQKSYTDDGQGDGRMTSAGLKLWNETATQASFSSEETKWSLGSAVQYTLAPTSLLFLATRRQLTEKTNEFFDRADQAIMAKASDNNPRGRGDLSALEKDLESLPISYQPLKLLFPAILMCDQATQRGQINSNAVLTALAVIRYERKHGSLPESLDEIVGEYLKEVPLDLLDGKPLRYRRQNGGFIIYSVGVNGVDDGGQPVLIRPDGSFVADPTKEEGTESLRSLPAGSYIMQREYPGDWVLWPRLSGQDE